MEPAEYRKAVYVIKAAAHIAKKLTASGTDDAELTGALEELNQARQSLDRLIKSATIDDQLQVLDSLAGNQTADLELMNLRVERCRRELEILQMQRKARDSNHVSARYHQAMHVFQQYCKQKTAESYAILNGSTQAVNQANQHLSRRV